MMIWAPGNVWGNDGEVKPKSAWAAPACNKRHYSDALYEAEGIGLSVDEIVSVGVAKLGAVCVECRCSTVEQS